jgi:hypothetical protein
VSIGMSAVLSVQTYVPASALVRRDSDVFALVHRDRDGSAPVHLAPCDSRGGGTRDGARPSAGADPPATGRRRRGGIGGS